jgi:hypothetical protein
MYDKKKGEDMQASASMQCPGVAGSSLFRVKWGLSNATTPYVYEASNVMYSMTQPITVQNLTNNATYNWDVVSMNSNGSIKGSNSVTMAMLPTVMGRIGTQNSNTTGNIPGWCSFSGSPTGPGDFSFASPHAVTVDRMYMMQTICFPCINANFPSDTIGFYDASSSPGTYNTFDNGLVKKIQVYDSNKLNIFTGYDPYGKLKWTTYMQVCQGQTGVAGLYNRVYDTCASLNGTTAFSGSFGSSNMQVFCNGAAFGSSNLFNAMSSSTYNSFVLGLNSSTGIPTYGLRFNAFIARLANKPSDGSLYLAFYSGSATNRLYYGGVDFFGNGSFTDYVDASAGLNNIVVFNILNGVPQTPKITITHALGAILQSLKTDSAGNVFVSFIVTHNNFSITDSSGTLKNISTSNSMPSTISNRNNCIVKFNSSLVYQWTTSTQLQLDSINVAPPNTVAPTNSKMCIMDVTPAGNVIAAFAPGPVFSSNATTVASCSSYKVETAVSGVAANSSNVISYFSPTTGLQPFVNSAFLMRLDGSSGAVISHTGFAQTDPSVINWAAAMAPMSVACSANENFALGWTVNQGNMTVSTPYAYSYQNSNATDVTLVQSSNYGMSNLFWVLNFPAKYGNFGRQYITGFDSNTKCSWESGILAFSGSFSGTYDLSLGLNVIDNTYVASSASGSYAASIGYYDLGTKSIANSRQVPLMVNRYNSADRLFVSFGSNGAIV